MQPIPILWGPLGPDTGVLAHRAVTRAGDVTQDAVEQEGFPTACYIRDAVMYGIWILVLVIVAVTCAESDINRNRQRRIVSCIEVGDHKCRRGQPGGLVDEQMCTLGVGVVRDEQAWWGRATGRVE
jgi:hypothetical protein